MNVLVCGAGVAGLTLAWCLERAGHEVTVIERRDRLRDDGSMIDFCGAGYDASERIGLLSRLQTIHDPIDRLTILDAHGRERASLAAAALRPHLFRDRHLNFLRGDLVRVLRDRVNGRCDVRLGITLVWLERQIHKVVVRLTDDTVQAVDLLVGADGAHSLVRHLAFGPESRFIHFLGYRAAAFVIDYLPPRLHPGRRVVTLTVPNRQVTVYPLHDGRIATFFLHRSQSTHHAVSVETACHELRAVYGDLEGLVPELIGYCEQARGVSVDAVQQIRMPRWSAGHVVLVGDACQCVSLLTGQGASMAIAGANVLAEELQGNADIDVALIRYEQRMRPVIARQQRAARRLAKWFVPTTNLGVCLHGAIARAAAWPFAAFVLRHQPAAQRIFHM